MSADFSAGAGLCYVDDPLCEPAALPPGSPERAEPGEMLAFAQIPTGSTTKP